MLPLSCVAHLPTLHAEMKRLYFHGTSTGTKRAYHSGIQQYTILFPVLIAKHPHFEIGTNAIRHPPINTSVILSHNQNENVSYSSCSHDYRTSHLFESQLTPPGATAFKDIQKETSFTKCTRPHLPSIPDIVTSIGKVLTKQPSMY